MKHLWYKKIWIMISMLLLGIFFSSSVYAQSWTAPENLTDTLFNVLWAGLNLLYLITLPVLVIAGKAMDNSMIYGEFINLDKPLHMLRNLSRTFANFAIGWVILRKVVQYIFNFSDNKSPAFLKSMMIKWVGIVLGINFSWFAIGALIDLSTITTYSLWAMPLSILKETNSKDMPILSVGSYFDYQSSASRIEQGQETYTKPHTYYQRWNIYIPRCGEKWQTYKGFITWPEYFPSIPNRPDVKFNSFGDGRQYCALNTQTLADITDLEQEKTNHFNSIDNTQANILMKQVIDHITITTWPCTDLVVTWYSGSTQQIPITIMAGELETLISKLKIGDSQIASKKVCSGLTITGNAYKENNRQIAFMTWWQEPYSSQGGLTMNTLINKSKGMVWPFITLYMSLLDFSNLSVQDTENQTTATTLNGVTEFVLKWAISIALFIPLVALALTLIIRIVILRWIIAFIPLGIVLYGLKDDIKMPWGGMKIWWAEVNAWSILWLIFAPVLPVFAISISIIILQTLQLAMKPAIDNDNKTRDFLWIVITPDPNNQNTSCMNFWWLQTTCLDKGSEVSGWSGFANFLPWLFVNIFAIGLMWMMVKVAISGSKLTWKIWWDIMDLWSKALGSIPLIKLWGTWIGASALSNIPNKMYNTTSRQLDQYVRAQDNELGKKLWFESETPTPTNTNSWSSFSLSNKEKASTEFRKGVDNIGTAKPKFDDYNKLVEASIDWKEEKEKFAKISNVDKSWILTEFLTDMTKKQSELESSNDKEKNKEAIEKIKTQRGNLTSEIIRWWYSDFITTDANNNKTIKTEKLLDFINYVNNSTLLKEADKNQTENTYRKQIKDDFKYQIEYKDGKFQAKTK